MSKRTWTGLMFCLSAAFLLSPILAEQPGKDDKKEPEKEKKDFFKDFGGFGGGKGGPMFGGTRKLVKQFDKDNDGKLNQEERNAAREFIKKGGGGGMGGFKGGFGKGGKKDPPKAGPTVTPADVKNYPDAKLYDPAVMRTIFLDFENKKDWEAEMADFYKSDVEIPATLTVDGKKYPNVGVHFRGMSSFFSVAPGYKRSLNISLDFGDPKQRLYGSKTLNLLNSNDDPTFMHTVLYSHIARAYIPAPKANYMKVVINGESWGVYVNAQQFNKDFLQENYQTGKGARWKVKGSPGGGGGLDYVGDKIDDYKRRYDIKSKDDEADWKALILLCKTLSTTPPDKLEAALAPMLDIDEALKFLALDCALINGDGYWVRASDYSIYRDPKGKFHVIPHDMNETFSAAGGGFGGKGPGGFGPKDGGFAPKDKFFFPKDDPAAKEDGKEGPPKDGFKDGPPKDGFKDFKDGFKGPKEGKGGMGGAPRSPFALDPLVGLDDARKPLRSKLLAVPSLKARYLNYVKDIAQNWLDWKKLGPIVQQHRALLEKEVEIDTHKLYTLEAFRKTTADTLPEKEKEPMAGGFGKGPGGFGGPGGGGVALRAFADQRREFLLNHPAIKAKAPASASE
jgi:spore coat protein CotH